MTTFHERLYGEESRAMFRKIIPSISEMSNIVFSEIEEKFSKSQYTNGKTLTRSWIASEAFEAYASIRKDNPNEHGIQITYGVAIDIRKDAILFPEMCIQHFIEDKYDQLFALLDFGNGPKCILPSDLDSTNATLKFFRISLAWLYLHEQAHLFQGHGSLYAEETGANDAGRQFLWTDVMFSQADQQLTGRNAWIKHSFELAADYEATNLVVQLLLIDDKCVLQKSSLWLLIAALTCLFHRFYGHARPPHAGIAVGTHPDPAIRMRDTYSNVLSTLMHPKVSAYVPWARSQEDVNAVMEHAYNAANMYMQIAHFKTPQFPEFMAKVVDTSEAVSTYFSGIEQTWRELRPKVLSRYFGFGEGSVRPTEPTHEC